MLLPSLDTESPCDFTHFSGNAVVPALIYLSDDYYYSRLFLRFGDMDIIFCPFFFWIVFFSLLIFEHVLYSSCIQVTFSVMWMQIYLPIFD